MFSFFSKKRKGSVKIVERGTNDPMGVCHLHIRLKFQRSTSRYSKRAEKEICYTCIGGERNIRYSSITAIIQSGAPTCMMTRAERRF